VLAAVRNLERHDSAEGQPDRCLSPLLLLRVWPGVWLSESKVK
jgi:hypothetical protein